ncbi:GH14108 [Drosophila grimshawi]|uniref:GH14108 n=2 Tax=Drosophila grimshawi TaxID=7222 RepID=B4JY12_DROGR|nr:GH14108 [Drosophila grimshawi]
MKPVDAIALNIPNYYMIISKPMDIGTMLKRVENFYYRGVDELILDFRQMLSNCYCFNNPNDLVYRHGQQLEEYFNKVLAKMPMGEEVELHNQSGTAGAGGAGGAAVAATVKQDKVEQECRQQLMNLKLHTSDQVRDVFRPKWRAVAQKVNEHQFQHIEEFHTHVQQKMEHLLCATKTIYESVLHESLDDIDEQMQQIEFGQLLNAVGNCSRRRDRCETQLSKCLDCKVSGLRKSLQNARLRHKVCAEQRDRMKEKCRRKISCNSHHSQDSQLQDEISLEERRELRAEFAMLPCRTQNEIMQLINECSSGENSLNPRQDYQWFDIMSFSSRIINLIKREMHPETKINLRHMKPDEKVILQRSLERRLENINQALGGSRRKYTRRNSDIRHPIAKRQLLYSPVGGGAGNGGGGGDGRAEGVVAKRKCRAKLKSGNSDPRGSSSSSNSSTSSSSSSRSSSSCTSPSSSSSSGSGSSSNQESSNDAQTAPHSTPHTLLPVPRITGMSPTIMNKNTS